MSHVVGRRHGTLAVCTLLLACGAGTVQEAPPPVVAVIVSPPTRTVLVKDAFVFTAAVANAADRTVSWSVQEGGAGGTVTAGGAYTAPAAAGTFHVVATANQDGTTRGTAVVTVPPVSVAVAPASRSLMVGESAAFTATVTNASIGTVAWSVAEGAAGGAVTPGGVYTAPGSPGTYHVVATAGVDGATLGQAEVQVTADPDALAVTVSPKTRTVFVKDAFQFAASVVNATDGTVSWSVQEGAAGGTVTAGGLYTAPATPGAYRVVATANEDGVTRDTAVVTVPTVSVTVSPPTKVLVTGASTTFTAAVGNASDLGVTWSLAEGAVGGAVTAGGVYTAPDTPGAYHVVATASVDGTTTGQASVQVDPPPPDLATVLATVAGKGLWFGHQSVGLNLLSGTQRLLDRNWGEEPVILATSDPARMGPGVLAEVGLGENYFPVGKIDAFQAAMGSGAPVQVGDKVDVAMMKFCFVDFYDSAGYWATGSVAALFARYQAAVAAVRAAHPGLTVVHFTVPLVHVDEYPYPGNDRREAFSALVRSTYGGGEPVFDLARLESTRADGVTRCTDASQVPALCPEWARPGDDGHLGVAGQDMASHALVYFLAALP